MITAARAVATPMDMRRCIRDKLGQAILNFPAAPPRMGSSTYR